MDFDPTNPFAQEPAHEPQPVDALDDFVAGVEEENLVPDLSTVITIKTSGGQTRYVPVPDGSLMTVSEALVASGLTVNGQFQVWLNGAQIANNAVVPAGETITIVGSVKGGCA